MTSGTDMLRKLASGVLPTGVNQAPAILGRADVSKSGFADLLTAAKSGELKSGETVTVRKGEQFTLSEDQVERLAAIADRAELSGASKALVELDGQWFSLDIGKREVAAASGPAHGDVVTGFDSIVRDNAQLPTDAALPADGASLLRALGKRAH